MTKFSPKTCEKIIKAIKAGNTQKTAAAIAGVSERTFYSWIEKAESHKTGKYVQFLQSVKKAEEKAKAYHPNHVAPPEMELLKLSILEDGWTQPIVIRPDYEIIDGFHRWTASQDPEILELTDGKVPCVMLNVPYEHQILSTVRHNRARGIHGIDPMSDIVAYLLEKGTITKQEVQDRLVMDEEEVIRLYDNSGMPEIAGREYTRGTGNWTKRPPKGLIHGWKMTEKADPNLIKLGLKHNLPGIHEYIQLKQGKGE